MSKHLEPRTTVQIIEGAPTGFAVPVRRDDYEPWRAERLSHWAVRAARRDACLRIADGIAADVAARVESTHGVILPDSLFRFWAFWRSLEFVEREEFRDLGLAPCGILDFFPGGRRAEVHEPGADGDPHEHRRHRLDPPQFQVVMSGTTDGLRFGLWYEGRGAPPVGVARYHSSGCGELRWAGKTLLQALRAEIEAAEAILAPHGTLEAIREQIWRLRLMREAIMPFETGERRETGERYAEAYAPDFALVQPPMRSATAVHSAIARSRSS